MGDLSFLKTVLHGVRWLSS